MRSNKLKMTKRFKSKRGGSSKPPPCKGRKKTVGQHKCEDSSGCKWIPKKGKVNGHCTTRTQSSNSTKSVKAKKNSVNGKAGVEGDPYYDPSHYKPLTTSERKDYQNELRRHWNDTHPLPKKGVKLNDNQKIVIKEMDFYKTSKETDDIDTFLINFKYKPQEDPPYEEWMDDYDEMSDVFIQAAHEAMSKFVK